ncbi:MAG TPA: hypothetical protein VGG48_01845 [Rhizomicrobium sp.]|jgi:hypothetical protein
MSGPDPRYDYWSVLDTMAPGVVATRELVDAVAARYAANDYTALTQDQVLAITGPLPLPPASMPRFADSNEDPFDGWVQYGPWLQNRAW